MTSYEGSEDRRAAKHQRDAPFVCSEAVASDIMLFYAFPLPRRVGVRLKAIRQLRSESSSPAERFLS